MLQNLKNTRKSRKIQNLEKYLKNPKMSRNLEKWQKIQKHITKSRKNARKISQNLETQ